MVRDPISTQRPTPTSTQRVRTKTKRSKQTAKESPEQRVLNGIFWWFVVPALILGIAGALVSLVMIQLTGLPAAQVTQGIVGVPVMLGYLWVRANRQFGFPPWPWKFGAPASQVAASERQSNSAAINVGPFARVNLNQTAATDSPRRGGRVHGRLLRLDWAKQTPPNRPVAVNAYLRLSNAGDRAGLRDAHLVVDGQGLEFTLVHAMDMNTGAKRLPVLNNADVEDLVLRFESDRAANLGNLTGTIHLNWTTDVQTQIAVPFGPGP